MCVSILCLCHPHTINTHEDGWQNTVRELDLIRIDVLIDVYR